MELPIELKDYPPAIADLQQKILYLDRQLRSQRETVGFCLNVIDRAIAFDETLKNDSQRKAKKTELLETDPDAIMASNELKRLEDLRAELDINLQLLRNTFSLLKLERRAAIAQLELQASAA